MIRLFIPVLLLVFISCKAQTKANDIPLQPDSKDYSIETVVPNIKVPWGMTWLPDGTLLVTERGGSIFKIKNKEVTEIGNVPKVVARGQGGMMDIAIHPNYNENGWIYFSFSSPEGEGEGSNTALLRARLKDNQLVDIQTVYKASPNSSRSHHFGSRIVFDREGFVYLTIGDRGNHDENPQDITHDGGKVYRLHDDGRIPSDNPFVNAENAKTAVFSYGHRNPQGMCLHPKSGDIWTHEHGPRGGDEINIIKKGANYGWPTITYGINYNGTTITDETQRPGMEQPLYYWTPSIAPSGMTFVTGKTYPNWENTLLVGSLVFEYLERLHIEDQKVVKRVKMLEGIGRVRNVMQGPDGFIYVGVEGKGILKIKPLTKG